MIVWCFGVLHFGAAPCPLSNTDANLHVYVLKTEVWEEYILTVNMIINIRKSFLFRLTDTFERILHKSSLEKLTELAPNGNRSR